MADAKAIDAGIAAAVEAQEACRKMAPYQRQAVLEHCVKRFRERYDELAMALCIEAGKPIKDSRGEVTRLIDTFKVAAEESVRIDGEVINLEISPRAKGYRGFSKRVPIGPCSFISPFNFPLNLAAHKVAPALAVGCPFVLKPASRTPIGALIIGEVLAETDLPKGAFSILPAHRDGADLFTTDERFKLLSFTGSPAVGWDLKARAGKKKVVLELGGNAACIVDSDQGDRLDFVVERMIFGAFYQSGQSCIGVQRILVQEDFYDRFRDAFVAATKKLVAGDPKDEKTFIGPMIDEKEAKRLDDWIQEAREVRREAALRRQARQARCSRRPCSKTSTRGRRSAAWRRSARSRCCRSTRSSTRRSPRSTTASSACRPACSPTTCARRCAPGTSSTSAAWWSATCRASASTTCPTAASRIPASAAKASATRSRT